MHSLSDLRVAVVFSAFLDWVHLVSVLHEPVQLVWALDCSVLQTVKDNMNLSALLNTGNAY